MRSFCTASSVALTVILLGVALGGCTSLECTAVACQSGMYWEGRLPATMSWEDAQRLTVRVCRNGECYGRDLAEAEADDADGSVLVELTPRRVRGSEAPVAEASLLRDVDGHRVAVSWSESGVADGDVFEVDIETPDGLRVGGVDATEVEYRVFRPNGPGCDPVCRNVTLGSTD